ncbi:hypothetical protein POPTR_009G095550v4 [Populus trichocarpa]|uniref:Uncharacterized protein n=1 Tax=Populus trichocarpa TaxID=3694 RepID=A0ACC0SHG6_POPTR|nr:hypothetical protein POPTR_009G095550v4 [Populus trichocarpa]
MEILKENKEEEIHVLMVALSSQGHLNPMVRLGKRLVNKGLHVTLATTEFTRHRMLKSSTINPTSSTISISGVQTAEIAFCPPRVWDQLSGWFSLDGLLFFFFLVWNKKGNT